MPSVGTKGGTNTRTSPGKGTPDPCSPQAIWDALLDNGATEVQAIGIMANMINESSLNPEAVQQGVSDPGYGLVQWENSSYPGASSLVTGNCADDIKNQVQYLAQTGGFTAASGSSGAEAAGNFAANYEKCASCQLGGQQFNARVANALEVEQWVQSGSWPTTSKGVLSAPTEGGAASSSSQCLVGFNGVFGLGQFCLLSDTEARAAVGGVLLVVGGGLGLVGLLILAVYGLAHTGAGRAAGAALSAIPGGEIAGAVAARTLPSARAERQTSQREARVSAVERQQRLERRERRAGITQP